jgi:hypothetical protein
MGREPWTSRLTVQQCPIQLSAVAFRRNGSFWFPIGTSRTISWVSVPDGAPLGKLTFEIRCDDHGQRVIYILRQVFRFGVGLSVADLFPGQTIRLTTTRPHFGRERFWFRCACGRRSGCLYLPTGETVFRCRLCYNLTYQSAQEHNTRAEAERVFFEYSRAMMTGDPAVFTGDPTAAVRGMRSWEEPLESWERAKEPRPRLPLKE